VKLTKGTVLAHKRKRAGIEQTTLAKALGISASALCKMEKGQREHDWTRFDTAHEMIERHLVDLAGYAALKGQLAESTRAKAKEQVDPVIKDWINAMAPGFWGPDLGAGMRKQPH
jgi:DNA-binding XRE family transcriptional regulator